MLYSVKLVKYPHTKPVKHSILEWYMTRTTFSQVPVMHHVSLAPYLCAGFGGAPAPMSAMPAFNLQVGTALRSASQAMHGSCMEDVAPERAQGLYTSATA